MLALILASAIAAPDQDALAKRIFGFLKSSGYSVTQHDGTSADVGFNGVTMNVNTFTHPDGVVSFWSEFAFTSPTLVDRTKFYRWTETQEENTSWWSRTRLDGYTNITLRHVTKPGAKEREIVALAQKQFTTADEFRRTVLPAGSKHASLTLNTGEPLVPDTFKTQHFIDTDFAVLKKRWKWHVIRIDRGGYHYWRVHVKLSGLQFVISPVLIDHKPTGNLHVAYVLDEVRYGDYWATTPPRVTWAKVFAEPGNKPRLEAAVDLSSPKSLQAIREEIETFARNVSEFMAPLPAVPPSPPPART